MVYDSDHVECLYEDCLVKTEGDVGKYYDGCRWSPDGECLMTATSDRRLYIYDFPQCLSHPYNEEERQQQPLVTAPWSPTVAVSFAEPIYDYQWYPLMDEDQPSTCFVAACCRDQPIGIFEAFGGNKTHSFLCLDHKQCVTSPISLNFTPDGSSLMAGFSKHIRFFDMATLKPAGKMEFDKKKGSSHQSLISCIAFDHDSFEQNGLFVCASYDSNVGIYDYYSGERDVLFEVAHDLSEKFGKKGICGGVTGVLWKDHTLTCSTRQCSWLVRYDIRAPAKPLLFLPRLSNNNQKLALSSDQTNGWLLSACVDGNLYGWDESALKSTSGNYCDDVCPPNVTIPLHFGPFTGCAYHPTSGVVCTASGTRLFDAPRDTFVDKDNSQWKFPEARVCLWEFNC